MSDEEQRKYELEYDEDGKILKAMVFGYFQPEDLKFFSAKYYKILEKINPKEYEVHFDSQLLRVTFQDMEGLLGVCFKLFQTDNFKKIAINCGTNERIRASVKKIVDTVGIENFEFV